MHAIGVRFALTMITLLGVALAGCSTTPRYNPTTFQYEIDKEKIAAADIDRVVIPHVNLGNPSRLYLEKEEPRIDSYVATYLKEHGYTVIPQRRFEQEWNTAVRAYGNPMDPTTGRVNMKTFAQIMQSVREQMVQKDRVDAFVFTDLLEFEVAFSGGLKHTARWDGVSRTPSLQGPGSGVSSAFDWNRLAAVASLQVSIFNRELERVFASRGGLDTTAAIDTRSSDGEFVRRRNILENRNHVQEGIELALHPFIPMKHWPGEE